MSFMKHYNKNLKDMKKTTNYIFTVLIIFSMFACDNYLKEERYTDVGYDYLSTKVGMEAAVTGVYQDMRWYTGAYNQSGNQTGAYGSTAAGNMETYFCLTEYGTDMTWEGTDGGNKDAFNKYLTSMNANHDVLNKFWNNNYKGITRANTVLLYLPKVTDMTDAQKAQRAAEVKFMRAFYYFDLVQHFGGLPLVTEGNVTQIVTDFKRAPVADVYKQIISDLKAAYAVLPDVGQQTDRGRATKWSASHLLAKVYLTRDSYDATVRGGKPSDLDSAAFYSEAVINSGKYALESNFAMVFDQDNQKVSKEIIWDVEYTKDAIFSGAGSSTSDGGNQLHLYWVTQYDVKPGMIRDQPNGRPWKRLRINPMFLEKLWDHTSDSRIYKTFKRTFICNNPSTSTKWVANYYYINPATNAATTEVLYSPPASLVGQPKQKAGDTCIYFSPKNYGALSAYSTISPKQTLLNDANYRKMLVDIYKAPYLLIPQDMYDTNNFPAMLKWLDTQRPDINYQAGSRNFHRMRLAETYLIAAEAYGRKGDMVNAAKYVNIVRQRAAYADGETKPKEVSRYDGGANNTVNTKTEMLATPATMVTPKLPSGVADVSPFVDWMLEERGRELYGELNRWEDLARTGTLVARAKLYNPDAAPNVKDFHKLRPIPNTFIDRLLPKPAIADVQNPGYY
jgi:starch-binding outer membrane protein, SusD/RagB family